MTSQNTRVEQIRQWLAQIALEEARLKGQRRTLEHTLQELAELHTEKQPTPVIELTNREIVMALLEAEGHSMKLTDVATRLWEAGLLTSTKGKSGVSATVSTIFQRGLGKVFERVGLGEYDLRSRVITLGTGINGDRQLEIVSHVNQPDLISDN